VDYELFQILRKRHTLKSKSNWIMHGILNFLDCCGIFSFFSSKVTRYWNGLTYSGFPVTCTAVKADDFSYFDELIAKLFQRTDCSLTQWSQETKEEVLFYLKHVRRTQYSLLYSICQSPDCTHCKQIANISPKFLAFSRSVGQVCFGFSLTRDLIL
jgi:hypothetical protein